MTERPTIVWRRSRWLTLLYLAGILGLGGFFLAILANGAPATRRFPHELVLSIGIFGVLVSGTVGAVGVLEVFNPTRLVIHPEGFEQQGVFSQPIIPWIDIEEFVRWRQSSANPIASRLALTNVGYRLTPTGRRKWGRWWRRAMAFGACDGWLMSGAGRRPGEIAYLLEAKRLAAHNTPS